MPENQIEALEKCRLYALRDKDDYTYIQALELQVIPCYSMGDTARCMQVTEECRRLYQEKGFIRQAAQVYPTAIHILLDDGQYERAHRLMEVFEKDSGLFDESGNISTGREHYYYNKGRYYLGTNHTDSAELYFRKLLEYHIGHDYDAHKGLLAVYQTRNNTDSIVKYSILCENSLDSIQEDDQADAISNAHSLYNYNRMEQTAFTKEMENERMGHQITILIIMLAILTVVSMWRLHVSKKRRKAELGKLSTEHLMTVEKNRQLQEELNTMKSNLQKSITQKEVEIERLNEQAKLLEKRLNSLSAQEMESALLESDTVVCFRHIANGQISGAIPSGKEWNLLDLLLEKQLPVFYNFLMVNGDLTSQEVKACILCRLNFSNSETAVLLGTSAQRITNIKSSANSKLFKDKSARSLNKNLKQLQSATNLSSER